MRIFCLNFHRQVHPSIAEAFLKSTPLLQFREPGLLFGDVGRTLGLFKSSKHLLEELQMRAEDLGFSDFSIALSDTAAGAQALTRHFDFFISESGQETSSLSPLPTSSLRDLEGLEAWENSSGIEEIAEFLATLGLHSLGDLKNLPPESWNLRWGDLGTKLQKKIWGIERATFTPFIPTEPLIAYQHLDFPISNQQQLLLSLRPRLQELLYRLEGRNENLDQVSLLLVHEYSNEKNKILISPTHKARDLDLLLTLFQERFNQLELENPIREWELEITPLSAHPQQLDFWEPHAQEKENLLRLQSLLHDRKIESGFLKVEPAQLPEKSWALQAEHHELPLPVTDFVFENQAHREIPVYSEGLNTAPRPTRLLDPPVPVGKKEIQSFRFLHRFPFERLDLPWQKASRDYWMALSPSQQCVWIYRDLCTSHYFLQGYFD